MKAGCLRVVRGPYWRGTYPVLLRDLGPVDHDQAQALIDEGVSVHAVRRAAGWSGDFPVLVEGLTVGELRAALAAVDLPDDTIVAIGSASLCREFVGSPASTHVEVGFYQPDSALGTCGSAYGGEPDYDADGNIPLHLPALVLNPTH
jgi:hypothetical protein